MKLHVAPLALVALLTACTDSPTDNNVDPTLSSELTAPNPCPNCVFGPYNFIRRKVDRISRSFTSDAGACTLNIEDDGQSQTTAAIWLNHALVVDRSALLGPVSAVSVPVDLQADNLLELSVRGGIGHRVTLWIVCGETLSIDPSQATVPVSTTRQFSVTGAAGPYTWSVNGVDAGDNTFGTIDATGLYLAPAAVPNPASFEVCARVTATPNVSDCGTVTITPPPTPRIVIFAGNDQFALPGAPVPVPPAVLVTQADGTPWSGLTVTFEVTSGGGIVTQPAPTTGPDGIATVGSWTLGDSPGTNTLTATAAGNGITGNPVVFTAQATLGLRTSILTIGTGWDHSCGITTGGTPYCWGTNTNGQVGDGTTDLRLVPVPVTGDLLLVGLSVGDHFTCGLSASGSAYCWGANGQGQVGDGTFTDRLEPAATIGGLQFVTLSSGSAHTCGITADSLAYCWGDNHYGQLGDDTWSNRPQPTAVAGGLRFIAISAGGDHTCALTGSGAAYCWGSNEFGMLGIGTPVGSTRLPTPVVGGLVFSVIESGRRMTCGILGSGLAYCWGLNSVGQLGDGTTTNRSAPTPIAGSISFTALAAGDYHACGLTSSGTGYCWGATLGVTVPVPTAIPGNLTFEAITSAEFGSCGMTPTGALYCWGQNYWGQLGDGTIDTNRTVPTPVSGGLTFLTE
jgi:alpha-tubulin suppressor-like RCC1 family protein